MLKRKINAQKLVHFKLLSYLCIRKRNKQQIKPKDPEGHRDYEDYNKRNQHQNEKPHEPVRWQEF